MTLEYKKISDLSAATSLSAATIVPVVQTGETKQATLSQLRGGMGLDESATVRFDKIGVDVASPQESLDVNGNIRCTQRLAFKTLAEIRSIADNSEARFIDLDFTGLTTQDGEIRLFRHTNTTGRNRMLFHRGNGSGSVDVVIGVGGFSSYFNSGSVGIGVGAPSEKLDVAGNVRAVSYITTSDYRLKENIGPVTDAAARLLALQPCHFTWSGDAPDYMRGQSMDGFLAHEVQAIVPEAASGIKDAVQEITLPATGRVTDKNGTVIEENITQEDAFIPDGGHWKETTPARTDIAPVYQGIDQSRLVPLLTAALQDALKRIEALETAQT